MVRLATERGYAVLAPSSQSGSCWVEEVDAAHISSLLRHEDIAPFLRSGLCLTVFGASSGGVMATMLPAIVPNIQLVVPQIAAPREPEPFAMALGRDGRLPDVAYLYQQRDTYTKASAHKMVEWLRQRGGWASAWEQRACAVDAAFWEDRLRVGPGVASRLAAALAGAGLLNAEGELLEDPRRSPWRRALKVVADAEPRGTPAVLMRRPIRRTLQVSWAIRSWPMRRPFQSCSTPHTRGTS